MTVSSRYQPADLVLVRATTYATDLELPQDFDPADDEALRDVGRVWLARAWSHTRFREALEIASPTLSSHIEAVLRQGPDRVSLRDLRRAVLSTISYAARWQRRTTPFGLFAGVVGAGSGPCASARLGTDHQVHLRADAEWLGSLVDELERHPQLRRRLLISADNTRFVRDGRVIVAGRPRPGKEPGPALELSVRNTTPVRAALAMCSEPIRFDQAAARLRTQFRNTEPAKLEQLLDNLIDHQILTTSLRAPMTTVDAFAHLVEALSDASANELPDLKPTLDQLDEIAAGLSSVVGTSLTAAGASKRRNVVSMMRALAPRQAGHPLAVDVRLDAQITLPEAVLREAAGAADVLVGLSTKPFGTSAWINYHQRFRARYGPGALVPVRELVADSGLGYPAGFLGSPQARPTWRMITERDAVMLALLQHAQRDHAEEIELTESVIRELTVGERGDPVPPQRVELAFDLHAATLDDIDRGRFELWIDAVPRSGSSMAGRFAYLLDHDERERLADSFRDVAANAVAMQLSFPPRRLHNENIVRTPALLTDVIHLSEFTAADVTSVSVDDLGVTADAEHLYLVHIPTGKRVAPRTLHALEVTVHTPPLARFLSEVADARSAVFAPFNFGAARTLPYTPRIRYRRCVLAPARWLLDAADLGDGRGGARRDEFLRGWAERWRVPTRVVLVQGELRLPLDLENPIDRALLRAQIENAGRVELREAGDPNAHGWLGVPAQLLVPLTLVDPPPRRPPTVMVRPRRVLNAGRGDVLHLQLIGNPARFDQILYEHIPGAIAALGDGRVAHWWIRRHRDLIRLDTDQHISLFLRLIDAEIYGAIANQLSHMADDLRARGLVSHIAIASYQPQAGRYGEAEALTCAERVFAADTAAAIAQIELAGRATIPAQSLTAASMAYLAAAFGPDSRTGYRLLTGLLKQEKGPLDRRLREHAVRLADPTNGHAAIAQLLGGESVVRAWRARDIALRAYQRALAAQRDPSTVLLTLLHDHHVRALGVDPSFEATTNRLARACALRLLAMTEVGRP